MSTQHHTALSDGLTEARLLTAFISEVVLAIAEKPAMSCPLSEDAWQGFFIVTQNLDERLQGLAEIASSLRKSP